MFFGIGESVLVFGFFSLLFIYLSVGFMGEFFDVIFVGNGVYIVEE